MADVVVTAGRFRFREGRATVVLLTAVLLAVLLWSPTSRAQRAPGFVAGDGHGWSPDDLGNHRAIVTVTGRARVVHVVLPWRRPDADPEQKNLIVTDSAGRRVTNVRRGAISREQGEIWFEALTGPGRYFVYYLPYQLGGRPNYPTATYPAFVDSAASTWSTSGAADADVAAFESIDAFNAFAPMQVIATAAETSALVRSQAGKPFVVFPEDREHPIRMTRDLPLRWIEGGARSTFDAEARRGEYLAFQFGVYALDDVRGLSVHVTDLRADDGSTIAATAVSCLNTSGTSWDGTAFSRTLDIDRQHVAAVWCGIEVPDAARPARYTATASVQSPAATVDIGLRMTVLETSVADGGADEPEKQTRLRWLNSTLAQQNDVVAPYSPMTVRGSDVSVLGRTVTVGASGLPERVRTFFTPEMTSIGTTPTDVLAAPMTFAVATAEGPISWRPEGLRFIEKSPGTVRWQSTSTSDAVAMRVEAAMEFDGYVDLRVALTAVRDIALRDVQLEIPYARVAATYMMGLGQKGGRRPTSLDWRWDVAAKNQDGAWIGGINAGLFYSLRGHNYVRPLNTNFYRQGPLRLPPSWGNGGHGSISIDERGQAVSVRNHSGPLTMKAGDTQLFNVVLIVTPFHPLDTDFQWRTRFYHRYTDLAAIKATGATVVNVHHATPVNPWINYPFIAHREMKAYVDDAHQRGLKVKIYNTVRELSNRAYELFPLRSLGHEVFSSGAGGGSAWLQEHVGDDYIAGWFVPELKDAALLNSGMSRWHNYYVEGLSWLVRKVGIDGIYVDDVAYDRTTMKRVKRVLTQDGHSGIIDFHSANQFNERDGFINSAVLYLEHFPYVNRLWFGEYFDYQATSPEFWLTEVSGIPFGLMGEMLEGGGNPWRGMVFGMTNRLPWSENADPRPLWRAWDDFGMSGTTMTGYWAPSSPVRTGRTDVLATVYRKKSAALVALASWAPTDVNVQLTVDWRALGIDPAHATIEAPAIDHFQPGRRFGLSDRIPVSPGKGWLLVVRDSR